jgi:hypothetical protein
VQVLQPLGVNSQGFCVGSFRHNSQKDAQRDCRKKRSGQQFSRRDIEEGIKRCDFRVLANFNVLDIPLKPVGRRLKYKGPEHDMRLSPKQVLALGAPILKVSLSDLMFSRKVKVV